MQVLNMVTTIRKVLLVASLALATCAANAQKKALTNDQYFNNNFSGIIAPLPIFIRWVNDQSFVMAKGSEKWLVDCKTGKERLATPEEANNSSPVTKTLTFLKNNDVYANYNGSEVRLTNDATAEVNPTVSPDGQYVAFTKNNNLYAVHIPTQKINQLTTDGSETILNGYASWVYFEEILGRPTKYRAFWWSPDSKRIAYFRADDSKVPLFILAGEKGLHGTIEKTRYPKVGDTNPEIKVGLISPDGGNTTWCDFNPQDDQYFGMPFWKPDGSGLLVQWMNREQNNLIIYEVNPASGAKKEFYNERQKTWVSLDDNDRITFLPSGKGFVMLSDVTGWRHLYLYDLQGKLLNPITSGRFSVSEITRIDEKNKTVYFMARSRENTARRDFYRVGLDGKGLQRLSFGEFNHAFVDLSPGSSYFITTYNNVATPNRMALLSNKGKLIRELGSAEGPEFANYQLAKTEMIRVKSEDGLYDLPMKVIWPTNREPGKKYPVLISIYGGPDAGNCMDTWSLVGNQQWYAQEGLIQVVMDHRASGHFGKEGVNYMHHNLGYWEMKDYGTMAKWLIANGQADPSKICITGFSYGGYMSCYALTYAPDIFTHGMAGGSVTDWTLYDTHYTERYMGTPTSNPAGYKSSSVFTHIDKLKGMLQIVHGEMDDNVHSQNSLQLISKLQDAKKEFEFMIYPGSRHGWGGAKGAHFQNLKTQFIYRHLLQKPVPKGILK
jgi:dipeptidyl-peptidase 4